MQWELIAESILRCTVDKMAIEFLGSGNSHSKELGNSSICVYRENQPLLVVDMGGEAYFEYKKRFGDKDYLPPIFITHNHMDHISGLERLFYNHVFNVEKKGLIKLFVPAQLVPKLHRIVASHGTALAEGGANFWDCFQLIPVEDFFFHGGLRFEVFPVRHQFWGEAFGFSLPGRFFYSGDTRPIPEHIVRYAGHGETIFHDAGIKSNPAHSGIDDFEREYKYRGKIKQRVVLYHMDSKDSAQKAEDKGWEVAKPAKVYTV